MGKFNFSGPPPLKTITVKVEEWDPEEEFIISELRALECQELIKFAKKIKNQTESDETPGDMDIFAEILVRCLATVSGEKPTKEWLMQSGFKVLKRLAETAMTLNGMTPQATEEAEKN